MTKKPLIAVILDENTSGDSTKYEASKNYFAVIAKAGGLPYGVPYLEDMIDKTITHFDGLLSVGGRFAYPDDWYIAEHSSNAPKSERFEIERAIMAGYLERDKPVLGICAGMQMLACLHGCRLSPSVQHIVPNAMQHDERGLAHKISIAPESKLADIVDVVELEVNTFHQEVVADLTAPVFASAYAEDGIIEAVEISSKRFAIGIQWHQELLDTNDHQGNRIFQQFVAACAETSGQS